MNAIVETLTGMSSMTDQIIALDYQMASKTGVQSLAIALTEASTPEVRQVLRKQLDEALNTHEQISQYVMKKGYYLPYQIDKQIQMDIQNANIALQIAGQQQQQNNIC